MLGMTGFGLLATEIVMYISLCVRYSDGGLLKAEEHLSFSFVALSYYSDPRSQDIQAGRWDDSFSISFALIYFRGLHLVCLFVSCLDTSCVLLARYGRWLDRWWGGNKRNVQRTTFDKHLKCLYTCLVVLELC